MSISPALSAGMETWSLTRRLRIRGVSVWSISISRRTITSTRRFCWRPAGESLWGAGSTGTHQKAECARSRLQRRFANAPTMGLCCFADFRMLLELHVISDRLDAVDSARHPNGVLDIGA